MKTFIIVLLLVTLFPLNSLAGYEVKYLGKGELAPFPGYLITPETEQQFRVNDQELNYQKTLNTSLDKINKSYQGMSDTQQARIDNLEKTNQRLSDGLASSNSNFSKIMMFLLGAATATLVSYGASRVVK